MARKPKAEKTTEPVQEPPLVDQVMNAAVEEATTGKPGAMTDAAQAEWDRIKAEQLAEKQAQEAFMSEQTGADADQPEKRGRGRPPKPVRTFSNGPNAERRAEVLAEYISLTTEGSRINQKKTSLMKSFEGEGGNTKIIKQMATLMKLDAGEAEAYVAKFLEYSQGFSIPIRWEFDGQASMADALGPEQEAPVRSDAEEELAGSVAHAEGYMAGKAGALKDDNPFQHIPGSNEYVQWEDGRSNGQADRERSRPAETARAEAAVTADATLPADGDPDRKAPF